MPHKSGEATPCPALVSRLQTGAPGLEMIWRNYGVVSHLTIDFLKSHRGPWVTLKEVHDCFVPVGIWAIGAWLRFAHGCSPSV
jgi:hypothetical protein